MLASRVVSAYRRSTPRDLFSGPAAGLVIAILMACRSAMRQSGKVVVVEHLLTPPNGPGINFSDITMMIMTGGRERTREEFAALFSAAGFHLEQVIATKSPFTLMVGTPLSVP